MQMIKCHSICPQTPYFQPSQKLVQFFWGCTQHFILVQLILIMQKIKNMVHAVVMEHLWKDNWLADNKRFIDTQSGPNHTFCTCFIMTIQWKAATTILQALIGGVLQFSLGGCSDPYLGSPTPSISGYIVTKKSGTPLNTESYPESLRQDVKIWQKAALDEKPWMW